VELTFHKLVKAHNATLGIMLSLVLIVSASLNLMHDHAVDHEHDTDCVMCVVDGNTSVASLPVSVASDKQLLENLNYSPVSLTPTQFELQTARGPPVSL
jgi:hypothetical protein